VGECNASPAMPDNERSKFLKSLAALLQCHIVYMYFLVRNFFRDLVVLATVFPDWGGSSFSLFLFFFLKTLPGLQCRDSVASIDAICSQHSFFFFFFFFLFVLTQFSSPLRRSFRWLCRMERENAIQEARWLLHRKRFFCG
jgi:hypothetical protein